MDEINEQPESRHHHSHHHSHRKHRSKGKVGKFLKKHGKTLKNITMLVLALALVASLAVVADLYSKTQRQPEPSDNQTEQTPTLRVEIPYFGEDVMLVPELAYRFMEREPGSDAMAEMDRLNEKRERLDVGLGVRLSLDVSGAADGAVLAAATLEVSEHADFSDPRLFSLRGGESYVDVTLLKTNTQYYYRFSYTLSDGTQGSVGSSFRTAATPRILSIDGIVNVRDIGGWKTTDGKTIRQGLLYRGSELDGAVEASYCVTEAGRHDMLVELGIRTDMDLRAEYDNAYGTHALGANVAHIYYPNGAYNDIFTDYCKAMTGRIFADLADESRYPVYLHCTYGLDRTGTICCLLEALLGVSEEDLLREYELSVLYNGYAGSQELKAMLRELNKLEGDTLQQKTENFLLDAGVTAEQIQRIRDIFLED